MKPKRHVCQMTMSGLDYDVHYFQCGKPAKFWIPDQFKRTGWGGRQYLCGVHARAYERTVQRLARSNKGVRLRPPVTPV